MISLLSITYPLLKANFTGPTIINLNLSPKLPPSLDNNVEGEI